VTWTTAQRERSKAKAELRKLQQRKASRAAKTLVRNRDKGEPLREPRPIKCGVCCDQPWRRRGICAGCGQAYQEERFTP
jgi:hypothetical protein